MTYPSMTHLLFQEISQPGEESLLSYFIFGFWGSILLYSKRTKSGLGKYSNAKAITTQLRSVFLRLPLFTQVSSWLCFCYMSLKSLVHMIFQEWQPNTLPYPVGVLWLFFSLCLFQYFFQKEDYMHLGYSETLWYHLSKVLVFPKPGLSIN